MRRLVAVLSSAAIALGVLVGVATPASAADVGTVTFTAGTPPTVSPASVTGQVGDTLTISMSGTSAVIVDGAALSDAGSACSPTVCTITSSSKVFTISGAGSVVLEDSMSMGSTTTLTIIIGGGSSSGPTDPALVYPTMYLNANGGRCYGSVPTQYTKANGQNGTVVLPSSGECFRSGYDLQGWARSADAVTSEFRVGSTVPIGDESFTLYAVWAPTIALVTYDANIGAADACIDSAGIEVPAGEGRLNTELNPRNLATTAPCMPDNDQVVLAGWSTRGDGPVVYQLGELAYFVGQDGITPLRGTRQRLYAVWQRPCAQDLATRLYTYSCVDFGDVAVGERAVLEFRITNVGAPTFGGTTVVPFEDTTVTSNGLLERLRYYDTEECRAEELLDLGQWCIVRYAWTPAKPGPLDPVRLGVCQLRGQECFLTPEGTGLRGNAYTPQPEPKAPMSTPAEQPEEGTPALAIGAERGEVKGKPGVIVKGEATGLEPGSVLVPWLRFPGQTEYHKGTARPEVQADGTFTWQRRTSKKVYVYFTSEDGAVESNRVMIQSA